MLPPAGIGGCAEQRCLGAPALAAEARVCFERGAAGHRVVGVLSLPARQQDGAHVAHRARELVVLDRLLRVRADWARAARPRLPPARAVLVPVLQALDDERADLAVGERRTALLDTLAAAGDQQLAAHLDAIRSLCRRRRLAKLLRRLRLAPQRERVLVVALLRLSQEGLEASAF
jgi:hypothetical protein